MGGWWVGGWVGGWWVVSQRLLSLNPTVVMAVLLLGLWLLLGCDNIPHSTKSTLFQSRLSLTQLILKMTSMEQDGLSQKRGLDSYDIKHLPLPSQQHTLTQKSYKEVCILLRKK